MPKKTRIYTRKGDGGLTSLGDRSRVYKDETRVAAYGTVDELNSVLGLANSLGVVPTLQVYLKEIQGDLLNLGADLAFPEENPEGEGAPRISQEKILQLESWIDRMEEELPPLKNFILPGGTPSASALHVARTICRRAERLAIRLARAERISEFIIPYLNRLSDCLFVMARYENFLNQVTEPEWKAGN